MTDPATKAMPLGDALVEQGLLTTGKLKVALAEHSRTGRQLGRVLIDNGFATEEQIARTLALQLKIPFIDLTRFEVVPSTVRMLSEMQARRYRALVLEERGPAHLIGMVDPFDLRIYDELTALLKHPIEMALITNEQFVQTADRLGIVDRNRSEEHTSELQSQR